MNKTSIEWTEYSWNPVTGCFHPCRNQYCYNTMKDTAPLNRFGAKYRNGSGFVFEKDWRSRETGSCHVAQPGEVYPYGYDPTWYPHRLTEPLKRRKATKIFVVDAGDLFGQWVPSEWIESVLSVADQAPQHTFQFLTKNPARMHKYAYPGNAWCGTSVNSDSHADRIAEIRTVDAPVRWLSIEPIMGQITADLTGIHWVVIGAMTGKHAPKPRLEYVRGLIDRCSELNIPVFLKDNLRMAGPREWPKVN